MNLSNFLIANLLSLSNLTHFFDRLIADGEYETVLLIYDEASVKNTNFVTELIDVARGKYVVVIMNRDGDKFSWIHMKPYSLQVRLLEIMLLNYDQNQENSIESIARIGNFHHDRHNIIVLFPMQTEDHKKKIWEHFDRDDPASHMNISVIFYQTKKSLTKANTSRKLFEIFVLNYNPFTAVEIDIENNFSEISQSNLNDKIFNTISKRPNVIIETKFYTSITNETVWKQWGISASINVADATCYLSNFIARNLRVNDVEIQHYALNLANKNFEEGLECIAPIGKYYAELNNYILHIDYCHFSERFVFLIFSKLKIVL